ncbi:hypothetical protein RDABS01_030168 [Bienertia sinuspersici]
MAASLTSRLNLLRTHHLHLPTISRYLCSFSLNSSSTSTTTTKPSLPPLQPSHDADLISNILIEHHNPFHAMESSLQLYGISPSSSLIHQTLIRLSHLSKIAFSFFSYSLTSYPSSVDITSFNIIIDILGKVRQFDVIWQLILKMETLNLKPQKLYFFDIYSSFDCCQFHPSSYQEVCKDDYVYVIDTLCKYGYVKVAMEFFNKRKSQFELRRVYMGEKLLREMIDKGIEPNVVCYNVLLNGICRKSSLHPDDRFQRTIRAADKVFDEMRERGIEPDVTSYSIVLHVCSRAHKLT